MAKVVILNSVGIKNDGTYIIASPSRWCEGIKSKSRWFAYYPWELAYLSSLLKQETEHEIKFIDGCLMKVNKFDYFSKILIEKPDWLIMESATITFNENLWLVKRLKDKINAKLIFVGQHASVFPEETLAQGIDYVVIGEYEYTVLEILKGSDSAEIPGLYPNKRRSLVDVNNLPWPEDVNVRRIDYAYPGEPAEEFREIEVFASRGCPFNCNFCVARNVYYGIPNWRPRDAQNIIDEMKYLKDKYPEMEGVFFNEEVHNGSDNFILRLCKNIINNKLDYLHYEAMCDVRLLNKESIYAMKQAGYYKIRIGIESVSRNILKGINKDINIDELEEKLNMSKKNGLKTYGTFMFGAKGSTAVDDYKTIRFMQNLIRFKLLDNVQVSICTPQPGTPFYNWCKEKGFINTDNFYKFDGGLYSVTDYPAYSSKQILNLARLALRVRDREIFKSKLNKKELVGWIKDSYRKYGFLRLLLKSVKRLFFELKFSAGKLR